MDKILNGENVGKKQDKFTWKKGDLEFVKKVWKGQEVDFFPWEKQPLRVPPKQERLLKKYKTIFEFQEDYKTKEAREQFAGRLMNYEIEELIELCDNIQGKIYYEGLKKKEKIFEFRKHPALYCIGEAAPFVTVYDGPGEEKFAEYGDGVGRNKTVRLGGKDITAIKATIEDNVLFEAEFMEDPYQMYILDGMSYEFFFAVKGRENEMYGSNIEGCREDFEHCMHSAHAIRALEEIRDLLAEKGVPKEYFEL